MSDGTCNEVYRDRNLVVQLAAKLASDLGYNVYYGADPNAPGWPVLFIELPTGQVSWHIPQAEVIASAPLESDPWDGHTTEEKHDRIRRFLS